MKNPTKNSQIARISAHPRIKNQLEFCLFIILILLKNKIGCSIYSRMLSYIQVDFLELLNYILMLPSLLIIHFSFLINLIMTTRKEIADIIFPEVTETIHNLEKKYPPRKNPICSRFAPSPTGFLHIGGIYSAFVSRKFAKQNNGTFFLRIEDTDQKREIEGTVGLIIDGMKTFGIQIDE